VKTWTDTWSVADVAVPLPPGRSGEHASSEIARWQLDFACNVSTSDAARAWDAWAADRGWRTIEATGPHRLGLTRIYEAGETSISISFCRMPGDPALVALHVQRLDDLPRTNVEGGTLTAHGLVVPLPSGVEAGPHDDLTDLGGEDYHFVSAPGLGLEEMLALYVPWAASTGLVLDERIERSGACALCFRAPGGVRLVVSFAPSHEADPLLSFAFRPADADD
jgi:hypothetical protein